ncbi:hypothetical protein LOTGIDRAFT_162562 [Lottia gigantea]|uniref:Uncharacterized protein n=1 Tax=Lottia gigantea TaxID=225164 RepID=V4A7B9_LOTGI|nr:hypothetical protein LOTGIDRAFT_162562 [Lottia gigantea]ESO92642.1 hypothetical protein LOTGIDRAFT_162562 [Lottia gigantea]
MKTVWISVWLLVAVLYINTGMAQEGDANNADFVPVQADIELTSRRQRGPCVEILSHIKFLTYKLEKLTNQVHKIPFDIIEARKYYGRRGPPGPPGPPRPPGPL